MTAAAARSSQKYPRASLYVPTDDSYASIAMRQQLTTAIRSLPISSQSRPYEHDPEKGFTMDIMMMMDTDKVLFVGLGRWLLVAADAQPDALPGRSARCARSSR